MKRAWCHASEQMAFLQASATDGAGMSDEQPGPVPGPGMDVPGLA